MKIHNHINKHGIKCEYWYDIYVKVWFAMAVDDDGNQIGDTIDGYRKEDVTRYLDTLAQED